MKQAAEWLSTHTGWCSASQPSSTQRGAASRSPAYDRRSVRSQRPSGGSKPNSGAGLRAASDERGRREVSEVLLDRTRGARS